MSEYLLATHGLTKQFGHHKAVDHVDLHVKKGSIYGFIGRNGAGKTTFLKMISGLSQPTSGEIEMFGYKNAQLKNVRSRISCLIESPGFYPNLTGTENLKIFAELRGLRSPKYIKNALELVNLPYRDKKLFSQYSLGMKQKLGLAQAIMEGQDILILDEPFNALDYKTYEDVKAIIRMLKAEGKTIFLTSHHFKDIEQLCDQVYSIEDCQLLPITEEIAVRYREME